jgi:hypothetical protein
MGGPGSGRRKGGGRKMSKSSTKPKRNVKSTFVLGKKPSNIARRKSSEEARVERSLRFANR